MTGRQMDRGSLVWGLVFTITGAAFLGQGWGFWEVRADMLLPALLIATGAVLVMAAAVSRSAP